MRHYPDTVATIDVLKTAQMPQAIEPPSGELGDTMMALLPGRCQDNGLRWTDSVGRTLACETK